MKNIINYSVKAALLSSAFSLTAYAETDTITFANPGEWVQVNLNRSEGDKRPIHQLWDSILAQNGLYQVAVPTKSGNRSVRHVAYDPITKSRLKYHILFNKDDMLTIQFEAYESKSEADTVQLKITDAMLNGFSYTLTPPIYCIKPYGNEEFSALERSKASAVMRDNKCNSIAYEK
ncbi:hypothetical protein [Kordiimonas sp. SCSIO 12610]|uniref:hypothetical protein n=1 Tax=Kordiimonas sp. SCSIO 12610 TaxID=2829597 RepID=UPI00210B535B|nr:hypothetical protein [Kordiimonas sp. SCSIO 12610]UTW56057.1 hypothetical protein KFF44_03960 [Kordiimonas sp. SCSIO 12610]